jgi:hypothetical protein
MPCWLLLGKGSTMFSFLVLIIFVGALFCTPLAAIGLALRERWQVERRRLVEEE